MYKKSIKPFLDKFFACMFIIFLSSLFIFITSIQLFLYRKSLFFTQERQTINGKTFKMYKYRTMTNMKDINGKLLPDSIRTTRFGKFLRFSSLDEIPSVINVILGDMSFVGPRPLPSSYYKLMSPEQKKRYSVKPGLTGLAQINGRNTLTWEEKFKYDLIYTERISFLTDLFILVNTPKVIFSKKPNADLLDKSFDEYVPDF